MASLLDQITTVNPDELTLHPNNPRQGDTDAIGQSLEKNQQFQPVVVQKSTGYVISGNHTVKAARELGWDAIDVVYIEVDDEHAKRIMLAANRTSELGTFDDAALAALLEELPDLDGTGYTLEEFDDILAEVNEAQEAADAAAAAQAEREAAAAAAAQSQPSFSDGEESAPAAAPEELPEPKYGAEDSGMKNVKSLDEKLEGYATSDSRSIILAYQGDTYIWIVEKLGELGELHETASNAATIRKLIEDAMGEEAP